MAKEKKELKNTGYEIFVGILSILSILNLVLIYVYRDTTDIQNILYIMNALLSGIFMGDFIYRLSTAPDRSGYFFRQFGWADLLASLPVEQLKILRTFRLLRVYRLLQEFGLKNIVKTLVKDRAGSALLTLILMGILVLQFGSLEMLKVEQQSSSANIKNASDAVWYTIVTISTVGYGDRYPVTNAGRIVGTLIIIIGVGIFGTFTGYLANLFLSPQKEEPTEEGPAPDQAPSPPEDALARLEQLKLLMAQQQTAIEEMERMLTNKVTG